MDSDFFRSLKAGDPIFWGLPYVHTQMGRLIFLEKKKRGKRGRGKEEGKRGRGKEEEDRMEPRCLCRLENLLLSRYLGASHSKLI